MKKTTKKKLKKAGIHAAAMVIIIAVAGLLLALHEPKYYTQAENKKDDEVSTYLTHELMPTIYNNAQKGEAFEIAIEQQGINDAIAELDWPMKSDGISFDTPQVFLTQGHIFIADQITIKNVKMVITAAVKPEMNEGGLLNLRVRKVKLGLVDITAFVGFLAEKIYGKETEGRNIEEIWDRILASTLKNQAFEPVFSIKGESYKVADFEINEQILRVKLEPKK